jgi:hypothetical protein
MSGNKRWRAWIAGAVVLAALLVLLIDRFAGLREERLLTLRRERLARVLRPSKDPRLGMELVPELTATVDGVQYSINSSGFRDAERDPTRVNQDVRILLLGGSVGFGWGVPQNQTAGMVLEQMFNLGPANVAEVINCSVPGYDVKRDSLLLADRLYIYAPDIVIVLESLPELVAPRDPGSWLLLPGASWPQLCRAAQPQSLVEALDSLHREAGTRNYSLVWGLLPVLPALDDPGCIEAASHYDEFAAAHGFRVADLSTALRKCGAPARDLHTDVAWEPNAHAQRVIADALWHSLISGKLVPRPLEILERRGEDGL